jgi:dTDP-L-rhamnose 4-epimerase
MRVLITGGAGFIGSRVARRLVDAGCAVRILDTLEPQVHGAVPKGLDWLEAAEIEFRRGSVTDRAALASALKGVEAVAHLAAETGTGQSMYEVARYNRVNSQGTAVLLDLIANGAAPDVRRVALASSRSIYGEGAYVLKADPERRVFPPARSAAALEAGRWEPTCPETGAALVPVPTREDDLLRPASVYAATKLAQEDLLRIVCSALGLSFAILRLQNVYGEGQSLLNPYTGVLSIFSTRIRRGFHLPLYEDGEETRDFVHVDDVARSIVAALCASGPIDAAINVGSGRGTSLREVAEKLAEAFDADPDVVVTGEYRLGDIRHNCADIDRLRARLGVTPEVDLDHGLRRFAAWVRTQPIPADASDGAAAELKARKLMR